jgi:poly(hydroxyalkanoate) granule-associated protein
MNDPETMSPDLSLGGEGIAANLGRELATAGRRVWLAGLGLIGEVADLDAATQRWVDQLAERGQPLAERQRRAAERLADRAGDRFARAGRRLEERATGGIAGALARLGVPTRAEIDSLSSRMAALAAKIDDMAAARETGQGPSNESRPTVQTIAGRSRKAG